MTKLLMCDVYSMQKSVCQSSSLYSGRDLASTDLLRSNKVLAIHTDVDFKNSQSCPFDKSHFQWDKVSKGGVLVLTSPSLNKKRAADGITIGRDICE